VIGVLLLLGAAVLLAAGAELFVENVAGAARRLGLSVLAAGLLLAGAEPEEALTGVIASASERPELAAGDAVGANVTMLTAALGLAAVARALPFGARARQYAVAAAGAGLLAVVVLADGTVGRVEGSLLLAAYAAIVALVWWREREPPVLGELAELDEASAEDADDGERRPAAALALALLGIVVMGVGGDLAVRGAVRVVASFGVTDAAIGLTALALATTAELFALVIAALRRDVAEVAVAGVVGSAAYNATVSLGLAAVVRPLAVTGVLPSAVLAALLPLVVVALARRRGVLTRPAGALLSLAYVAYVATVLTT
jgi:cation:H+ antiporter